MSIEQADPATADPVEFALLVKRTSAAELRHLLRGERRAIVLDGVFLRMPELFRADRAKSLRATVHWVIADRADGGSDRYELCIADGVCVVSPAPAHQPDLTLTATASDFLHIVTGNAHPVLLVMRGRLKTSGDRKLTAKFPTLFDVPKV